MKIAVLVAALAAASASASASAAPRNDHQVTSLPRFADEDQLSFDHFAGQLELDTTEKLFYWYAESQQDAGRDPIVLWLNGGPGCSSINGLFTENGPFVVDRDLSVKLNKYAWNRKANVVWVESPAGVGFSGPQQRADYYNDDVVADRLHQFLAKFLAKYPELRGRDFYVTGESYAGIYIPYLVDALVERPIDGLALKGFAIGNPFTDNAVDGNAYMDYYYYHALVSRQTYHKMLDQCGNDVAQCMHGNANCSAPCQAALDEGYASAGHGRFNAYNIYGDVCQLSNGQGGALHYKVAKDHPTPTTHRGAIGPCADTFTFAYLNSPELKAAVHVDAHADWVDCNPFISQHFARAESSLPKYRTILGRGLKALIYSGDADSVVNFVGTQRWITQDGLDLEEVDPWAAWYGPDQQLAGYEQGYDGLTFKTVKGAGHMVPAVKPLHGLYLFECFLYGNDVCETFEYPVDAFEVDTGLATVSNSKKDKDERKKKAHGKEDKADKNDKKKDEGKKHESKKESGKKHESKKDEKKDEGKKHEFKKDEDKKRESKKDEGKKGEGKKKESKKEDSKKEESKKHESKKDDSKKEESKKHESKKEGSNKEEGKKHESKKQESKKEESKKDEGKKGKDEGKNHESKKEESKKEESKKEPKKDSKKDASTKEESKKQASNKDESKKESTKVESKKDSKKDTTKDEGKKEESKKNEGKKEEANNKESKKEESKKDAPKKEEAKKEEVKTEEIKETKKQEVAKPEEAKKPVEPVAPVEKKPEETPKAVADAPPASGSSEKKPDETTKAVDSTPVKPAETSAAETPKPQPEPITVQAPASPEQVAASVRGATLAANVVAAERREAASSSPSSTVYVLAGAALAGVAFYVQNRKYQMRRGYESIPMASSV